MNELETRQIVHPVGDLNSELHEILDAWALQRPATETYKKLRYREEHSASVVLSWCNL